MNSPTRDETVTTAAFFGLAGTILASGGSIVASLVFSSLGPWFGAVPAILVWAVSVYYGMKQFAHGIYVVVEDAGMA